MERTGGIVTPNKRSEAKTIGGVLLSRRRGKDIKGIFRRVQQIRRLAGVRNTEISHYSDELEKNFPTPLSEKNVF